MEALTTISTKYQIVIPREVREQFDLKPGQKVMFIPYKNSIRLVIVPRLKMPWGYSRVSTPRMFVKKLTRNADEHRRFVGLISYGREVELDRGIAIEAAQISRELKLAMADSIILATARVHHADLWTQDEHFKNLPEAHYIVKK